MTSQNKRLEGSVLKTLSDIEIDAMVRTVHAHVTVSWPTVWSFDE